MSRTTLARSIISVTLAIALAGCSDAPQEVARLSLEGTSWRAIDIDGEPTVGGAEPTLEFTDLRVKGSGGCNAFGGSYTLDDPAITVRDIGSTLRLCQGEIGEVETRFMRALVGAQTATVDDAGELHLEGAGGAIRLVPGNP